MATSLPPIVDVVGAAWIRTVGANGEPNSQITYLDTFPDHGYISAKNAGGFTLAGIYVDHEGNGVVSGDVKSFRVPHPENRPWTHARAGGDPSPDELWAARLQWIERRGQRIREREARLSAEREREGR